MLADLPLPLGCHKPKMPNGSVGRRRKALSGIDAEIVDSEDPLHWLPLQRS
jgi:hypothetical protein